MANLTPEQIVTALMSPLGLAKTLKPDWIDNWHQHKINDALERVFIGRCKRLIINVPPRSGKTELAVKMFIAWATGHYPDSEWIHASYSKRLAARNTYETRSYMQHEFYAQIFPALALRDDGKAKDEFYTSAGGVVYATGSEGTITGYGAGKKREGFGGAVIVDDPLKAGDAYSETMRQNVNDWYMSTMQSRLNNPDTPVIVIMQRLHEDDLTGFLLDGGSGERWEHLVIPALDEEDKSFWESQLPSARLLQMREANSMIFAGQYMQTPVAAGGNIIKTSWFRRHHVIPDYASRRVHSWDTAYKSSQHNDPSCCTIWRIHDAAGLAYLEHVEVGRYDYPMLRQRALQLAAQYPPSAILVEDKASGQSLLQELRGATSLPLIAIIPEGDKLTRAVAACGMIESGNLSLPHNAAWLSAYESELSTFPAAKHDDQVDSTSQFISWWQSAAKSISFEQTLRERYGKYGYGRLLTP